MVEIQPPNCEIFNFCSPSNVNQGSLPERMPHFDPEKHTTEDVVRQAIIPMSRGTIHGDCAAAVVLMGNSVVQFSPFFVSAPLKMVFPRKGSLFSRVTEQLRQSFDAGPHGDAQLVQPLRVFGGSCGRGRFEGPGVCEGAAGRTAAAKGAPGAQVGTLLERQAGEEILATLFSFQPFYFLRV